MILVIREEQSKVPKHKATSTILLELNCKHYSALFTMLTFVQSTYQLHNSNVLMTCKDNDISTDL